MAIPRGGGNNPQIKPPRLQDLQEFKFVEARVNGGMITTVDAADIDPGALQRARNARVRYDKTSRRFGSLLVSPSAPDTNPVTAIASLKKENGTTFTYRFTPTGVYMLSGGIWTAISGTLTGSVSDRFQVATVLDSFVFANNGADNIQVIDTGTNTFGPLGDAPKYRYITGFFNRVVGAALADVNEVQVGWSGDGNQTEWNPAVDISAGSSPLVESPADLSDYIKGIAGFTNVMIVARERSLWYAIKQPSATNPFYFISAVPGIGCNCPHSIALVLGGIAWVDLLTQTAWYWQPGAQPERIGLNIENQLFAGVNDPETIFASYDPINNEYTVAIPQVGTKVVIAWTYNFRTKAWVFDQYYDIACIEDIDFSSGIISIDDLGDTPIDSLVGTIDSLSPDVEVRSTRFMGRGNGDIIQEDVNTITDAPHPDFPTIPSADPNFVFEGISKAFILPETDMYVAEIVIEYVAFVGGSFQLQYSKNGGMTDDSWITAKTITPVLLKQPQLITFRKQVKCRRYAWRLLGTAGIFDVLGFEVHVYPSGKSRQTSQ